MELKDFLTLLSGVGAIAAISWLWEYFGWFPTLDEKKKKLVLFGFAVLVAIVAFAVKTFVPADILAQISPIFAIIAAIFVNLFAGEAFHKVTK